MKDKAGIPLTDAVAAFGIDLDHAKDAGVEARDAAALALMLEEAQAASEHFAEEGNVTVEWEGIWQIEPVPFDETLIGFCDEAILET